MGLIPRVCLQEAWFSVAFSVSETLGPKQGLDQGEGVVTVRVTSAS